MRIRKTLLVFILIIITAIPVFAQNSKTDPKTWTNDDVILYQENSLWGLKSPAGEVLVKPTYKKMIRIGYHSWIVQSKKDKFGLTDVEGNILVPVKYRQTDRILGKFAKFGNTNDFGKVLLDNEYDDIYMPTFNSMRILYKGEWYEVEQVNSATLTLPENAREHINDSDINVYKFVKDTAVASGYSVLTLSDYIIKLFSSISPAHEETIDELMLSHGADTLNIYKKFLWLPKYPITYAQKYYQIIRNPNSGPLTDLKNDLKKKMN